MSRPPSGTDRRLIEAGRKMICETGLARLSIRRVAAEAGVNLGLFHYHFKSKEHFGEALLKEIYEEFFKKFSLESSKEGKPLERLRRSLNLLGRFARDRRELALALIQDVMENHKPTVEFLNRNFFRHVTIVEDLLVECQRSGDLPKIPIPMIFPFIMATAAVPGIVVGVMSRAGAKKPFGVPFQKFHDMVLSDDAISFRIDMAINGLKHARGWKK